MRHPHSLVAFFNATLILIRSVSALNHTNFELQVNLERVNLTAYVSSVLCSIDLKYANIYFELESAGTFLDGIVAESSRCVPPTLTIITYKKAGQYVMTNTSDGARLIILIAREFQFEKSMFPKVLRIRNKFNFELFYMIVSEVKMSVDHETLLKVMYSKYRLLNAVVVAMEHDSWAPSVITYNPFNNTIIRIPNNAFKRRRLFVNKNANIFGSPISIVAYRDLISQMIRVQGSKMTSLNYDALLPELISYAMNATLILQSPSFGMQLKSANVVGTVDLTINGRSYESSVILGTGIEATSILRRDDVCLLLRYKWNRNTFSIIYRTVDPFVWSLMIAVTFHAWISLFVIRWAHRNSHPWKNVFLFDLFGFHMNQGLTQMPKQIAPRLIIVSCLIYCLVIKSIFEGLLYTSMANDKETKISTIDELLDSNEYEILISNGLYNISSHFVDDSPIKNHFRVVEYLQFMKLVDSYQQYAYVVRRRLANYIENTKIVKGIPAYYTMDECVVPFITRYFVRQGSPFLDQINKVLRLTEESGIYDYWEKQLVDAYNTLSKDRQLFIHRPAINFEQFFFVFQTLEYGLAIAVAVFVLECCASRLKTLTKNLFNSVR